MERVRNQAKEMFPNIHLTLISIIQALALEVLWSAVNEREHLWAWNAAALTGWLQAAAVFEQSGQVLAEMTDAVVDYLLGESDTLGTTSDLITEIADLEERAFRIIRDARKVGE